MELVVRKDLAEWVRFASDWLLRQKSSGARSIFLPAGETPRPLYEIWNKGQILDNLNLFQIDEIINAPKEKTFEHFFLKELPNYKISKLDQCNKCCDVSILGLGLNGHVGFHEPELPEYYFSGCVRLESSTRTRLQLSDSAWGVTYGVGAFLKSRSILLIVRGESKKVVLKSILNGEKKLPAAWLLKHAGLTILTDFEI